MNYEDAPIFFTIYSYFSNRPAILIYPLAHILVSILSSTSTLPLLLFATFPYFCNQATPGARYRYPVRS